MQQRMELGPAVKLETAGLGRLFCRILTVVAVVVLADFYVAFQFNPIPTVPYAIRILRFWQDSPTPQIILLGSSRPRENLDDAYLTRRLKESGYLQTVGNLAFSGGGAVAVSRQFVNQIRPRWASSAAPGPRYAIIDVGEIELHHQFTNEKLQSEFDDVEEWIGRFEDIRGWGLVQDSLRNGMAIYQRTWLDEFLLPVRSLSALYRFNCDWSKKEEARKAVRRAVIFWKAPPAEFLQPPAQALRYLSDYRVGDTQVHSLEQLIDAVRADGATPILTALPQANWRRKFYSEDMWEKYTGVMRSVSERLGVPFVELSNEESGLTDESYFDDVHLKREYRQRMSEVVLQRVILPALGGTATR